MRRLTAIFFILVLISLAAAATAPAAWAAEFRLGGDQTLARGQTIKDDLYVTGNDVRIEGLVNGNVFASGQNVIISGVVHGTVFAAGQVVQISGDASGTAYVAGQYVTISGRIRHDLAAAGQQVNLSKNARVDSDFGAAGATIVLDGSVGKNVGLQGGRAAINGPVGGNVFARVGNLVLGPHAAIGGDLTYVSENAANIAKGVVVNGLIAQRLPNQEGPSSGQGPGRIVISAVSWARFFVGMTLFALIAALPFQAFWTRSTDTLVRAPWWSLGIGLALAAVAPVVLIAVIVLGAFIGGWWIGLIGFALYGLGLLLGYVTAALFVGKWMLARVGATGPHAFWSAVLGVLLFAVLGLFPYIGAAIIVLSTLIGFGALLQTLWGRELKAAEPVTA